MTEFDNLTEIFGDKMFDTPRFLRSALWIAKLSIGQPFLGKHLSVALEMPMVQGQREIAKLHKVNMVDLVDLSDESLSNFKLIGLAKPWARVDHPMWEVIELTSLVLDQLSRSTDPSAPPLPSGLATNE